MTQSRRGQGCVYRRKVKLPDGTKKETGPYWIKYYVNGVEKYESSETTNRSQALRLLNLRQGQKEQGTLPNAKADKILYDDLAKLYIQHYKLNELSSLETAEIHVKTLDRFFKGEKAASISTTAILEMVSQLKEEGYANASINLFTGALMRMFNLGREQKPPLVLSVPPMNRENGIKLKVNNVRKGFLHRDTFLTIRAKAPDHVKVAATLFYWHGLRKSDVLVHKSGKHGLKWPQVDFERKTFRLEVGTTKNGEGRTIPMLGDTYRVLWAWFQKTKAEFPSCEYVVHWGGKPIKSIRTAWKKACEDAGFPGIRVHDNRRTAARDLIRTPGVTKQMAKMITGHKTDSIFDRYDITDEIDLLNVQKKVEERELASELKEV